MMYVTVRRPIFLLSRTPLNSSVLYAGEVGGTRQSALQRGKEDQSPGRGEIFYSALFWRARTQGPVSFVTCVDLVIIVGR